LKSRVSQQPCRAVWVPLILVIVLTCGACGRTDQKLEQQRDNLKSLTASTAAIGEAWLAGSISGTFTATALEQVFLLLEQQRQALAAAPKMLVDQRGVELSQASEALARLLAAMMHDVRAADAGAVREHLAKLPTLGLDSR
jgi:hypothetical protein